MKTRKCKTRKCKTRKCKTRKCKTRKYKTHKYTNKGGNKGASIPLQLSVPYPNSVPKPPSIEPLPVIKSLPVIEPPVTETQSGYFDDIVIYIRNDDQTIDPAKFNIQSILNIDWYPNAIEIITTMFRTHKIYFDKNNQENWTYCLDSRFTREKCFSTLEPLFKTEMHSTSYILRCLSSKSVINIDDTSKYIVYFILNDRDKKHINGIWENDKQYFKIKFGLQPTDNLLQSTPEPTVARLIMAFGPSASGKTYIGENVIKILSQVDTNFPKSFMTIDGGNYRDLSYIYQFVLFSLNENGFGGFNNLVSASKTESILHGSLFEAGIIKKQTVDFLINQKQIQRDNLQISLYIPETSSSCRSTSLSSKYKCPQVTKKYLTITNDENWSAILVFQHKTGAMCPYPENLKCKGCTESGASRQITEGKKYDGSSWDFSYYQGEVDVKQGAKGYKLIIHNSGGRKTNGKMNKSIIYDFSETPLFRQNNELFKPEFAPNVQKITYLHNKMDIYAPTWSHAAKELEAAKEAQKNTTEQLTSNEIVTLNIDGKQYDKYNITGFPGFLYLVGSSITP
jgi:hypothetical protein